MGYEDTKIEKTGNICCLIFAGVLLYALVAFTIQLLNGKTELTEFIIAMLFMIPFLIILICIPFINIKNAKRNRELALTIKENGKRVRGKIKKIETTNKTDYKNSLFKRASFFRRKKSVLGGGVDSETEYYDFAVVEYEYNDEVKIVNTPYIDFYKKDLTSKDVDVYIYEDKVYVDNFKLNTERMNRVHKNWTMNKIHIFILFILVFLSIAGIVFGNIMGIIPTNILPTIIIGLMIIYLVVASIVYLSYLSDYFNNEEDNKDIFEDEKN